MNNKSAALFRASNIELLDYPYQAAIESALYFFDEVVIVGDPNSQDETMNVLIEEMNKYPGCVTLTTMEYRWDRMWQEKWWKKAAGHTDADWLAYFDLDDILSPIHYDAMREAMDDPSIHLINFPLIHFFGTSSYTKWFPMHRNTRVVRRSEGSWMINRCTDKHPNHAACFMTYQGDPYRDAHLERGEHVREMSFPLHHFGWCRSAGALAWSQLKHRSWYADGAGIEDGTLPDVAPYDFRMAWRTTEEFGPPDCNGIVERIVPLDLPVIEEWVEAHEVEWSKLNKEARNG